MSTFTSSSLEEQKTVRKKASRNKTGSILVLDDEFDLNTLIKLSLQKRGYDVFGFTDPLLALEHFHINSLSVLGDMGSFFYIDKKDLLNYEMALPTTFENMNLKGFCLYHKNDFDRRLTEKERQTYLEHHGKTLILLHSPNGN